ncbi:MAG: ATP synthase F1 subunit delta [Lachnospiraceae bacterium]|nr:ATP synthase F1 subunit delta [Lachnospiraceae bacterium]
MAKQVNSTYGDALFDLAVEEKQVDSILEELTALVQVLEENPDLVQLLVHPEVLKEDKLKMIQNIFQGKVSDAVMGTLLIVVKNDRSSELPNICNYVIGKMKEYKNIGIAFVTSAMELTKEQKSKIEERLVATTKYETMEMHYVVDSTIIGGLIIRIEDRVVDSSIKRQLERMSTALSQG